MGIDSSTAINDRIGQRLDYQPWEKIIGGFNVDGLPKNNDILMMLEGIRLQTNFIVESIKNKNTDLWQISDFDNNNFTYAQDLKLKPEVALVEQWVFSLLSKAKHPILWWDCWWEWFTREVWWKMVQWIMSEKQMIAYRSKLEYYKSNFKSDKSRWTDDRDIRSLMIRDKKSDYDGLLHLALAKHVIDSGEDRTQYMSEELYDLSNWNK